MSVLADATAAETLVQALTSGFTTMANDIISAIGSIVPVLLPVFAAFAVVAAGLRIAHRVAG